MKKMYLFLLCMMVLSGTKTNAQKNMKNSGSTSRNAVKTAIVYSSKYGTTEKVAKMVAEKMAENNDVTLIALNDNPRPDITAYSKVILGTSIYVGKPRENMKEFCKNNHAAFEGKTIGLFVCGGEMSEEKRQEELKNAYPDYLHEAAVAENFMGGEYQLDKMSFVEKKVIQMVKKVRESASNLDYDAINVFSIKMK